MRVPLRRAGLSDREPAAMRWDDPGEREYDDAPELALGSITTVTTTDEDDKRAEKRERPFPFGFAAPAAPTKRAKRRRKAKP